MWCGVVVCVLCWCSVAACVCGCECCVVACVIECAVESDRVGVVECDRFSCVVCGGTY